MAKDTGVKPPKKPEREETNSEDKKPDVTRERFLKHAKPVTIKIGDQTIVANVKEFSTGSFGFHGNQKVAIEVDGVPVRYQANILITALHSKPDKKK